MDQAAVLRQLRNKGKEAVPIKTAAPPNGRKAGAGGELERTRVISITSGKGGVGKTHISANLAYMFCKMNKRTLIFDADMGLANVDVILGLAPKYNLHDVLKGEKALGDVLVRGPGDVMILPSASGVQELANLSTDHKIALRDELDGIGGDFDFMLIDTAAGIAGNVMYFNMAAKEIIVVITPEPTSLTDAYAMIKILYQGHDEKRIMILVNMARSPKEAGEVFKRLGKATEHFLNLKVEYLGYVLFDEKVTEAVLRQRPLVELYPNCRAGKCLFTIAEKICNELPVDYNFGSLKFFSRAIVDRDSG